jgi:two-component system heavy metal sensor histidine kinase CusS
MPRGALMWKTRPLFKDGMTIKMRLAVLFTVLVAVILACFTWVIYGFASYQQTELFYSELKTHAIAMATVVLRSDNLSDSLLEPYRKKVLDQFHQETVDIYGSDGQRNVFHRGERVAPLDAAVMRRALDFGVHRASVGPALRELAFPFRDEEKQYVVRISAVDEHGLKTMARLRWSLFTGYVASLAIVFAAGRLFASEAIAPLARITNQAQGISATDLHVRVEAGRQKDELSQLARAFNGMLDRLEKAFRSQKQFIANASHELRTPLTTMEGQLEVSLMKRRSPEEYRRTLAVALEEVRALRVTTNNLLLLTKAGADTLELEKRPVRIDEVLLAALEEARRRYPHRNVEIEYSEIPPDENALLIDGNEDLLRNAFLNLIENAIKYSPAGSPSRVSVEAGGRTVAVRVSDEGSGIAPEDMPRIFEPFFRSGRTQSVPGSGIGLTLVKAIVERHAGTLEIRSAPDQGTVVSIVLPLAGSPSKVPEPT